MLLWDRGTWEPVEEPDFRKGRLKFNLFGEKLHGRWALVRMAPRPGDTKPNWLLIKDRDSFARRTGDITEERPESVDTGRTMEEIGADTKSRTWQSKPKAGTPKRNEKLTKLAELDCLGVICTAPGNDCDFVSRFFAPAAGIPEDPVTGSAHSTLTPYWSKKLGRSRLHARQLSLRRGELWCEDRGDRVGIGGRCALYSRAEIEVPG